ncbi:hypothetical protein [Mesorhizobium sp.]|uniref:hypothetical protein n=1 Tax=Mesorhizobium sp. TaxID=1871066 RepID=UPI000FE51A48|nr:hypothetical protein [Mesorhizobium sp.]RWI90606.1 MAG: hypothetical protein EOR22_24020 [Mesorhizobium sp.]TIQ10757.1 MAG: hypothetical protein E5X50_08075 [Mesorhizobium sp.]TIR20024.1 MAG: hypothetical protein E5X33_17700 [Mesorhizobium sp.]
MAIPTSDHTADMGHLEEPIEWLRHHRAECGRPAIPSLRRRFGISAREACHVLRISHLRDAWPADDHQGGADDVAHS